MHDLDLDLETKIKYKNNDEKQIGDFLSLQ